MNELKIEKIEPSSGYTVNPRYIFHSLRNSGWSVEACINELIDNAIDAGASKIDVGWEKHQKNHKDEDQYYKFSCGDNGGGVIRVRMRPSFTELGTETTYELESIGKYGVGGTSALVNLCEEGTIKIKSSALETKETSLMQILHTLENQMPDISVEDKPWDNIPGVTIEIDKVKSKVTESTLIKKFGVTYFPQYDRTKERKKKTFEIN